MRKQLKQPSRLDRKRMEREMEACFEKLHKSLHELFTFQQRVNVATSPIGWGYRSFWEADVLWRAKGLCRKLSRMNP